MDRHWIGDRGEDAVAKALEKRGWVILERQYRSRWGEIDLIGRDPDGCLCFVEVKARSTSRFSAAREAVTPSKQKKLRITASLYLEKIGWDAACRFDVAEVYPGRGGDWNCPRINYIANAF